MSALFSGPAYLRDGLRTLRDPALRGFVLWPLLINVLLFAGIGYFAYYQFDHWLSSLMPTLPDWLSFLHYVLWPLFVVCLLLMIFFTFTLLANLVASPFNGLLAEKVEVMARGEDHFPAFSMKELVAIVPRTLARELQKMRYFLPRAIGLLILSFIPVVNLIAAPLWLIFGAWMMAVQYIDYPADNNKVSWNDMLTWIRQRRWSCLSFGGITYLLLLVPLLNLLIMPAAIVGATLLWVKEQPQKP